MKEQIEKQAIEEMVKVICDGCGVEHSHCGFISKSKWCPTVLNNSKRLYNAGYRKQSEGEWEKRTFIIFDNEKVGFRCSECNTNWDTPTNFCPNCGAKMKGTNDEKTD